MIHMFPGGNTIVWQNNRDDKGYSIEKFEFRYSN